MAMSRDSLRKKRATTTTKPKTTKKKGRVPANKDSEKQSIKARKGQQWRLPTRLSDGPKRNVTDQQAKFCEIYVENGGDWRKALVEAGYSCATTAAMEIIRKQLMKQSHVIAYIRQVQKDTLTGEIATLSLGVIKEILIDKEVNPRIRLDAAKFGIEKAGLDEARFELPNSLETLTLSDLQSMLSETQEAISAVAGAMPTEILDESDVEYQEITDSD